MVCDAVGFGFVPSHFPTVFLAVVFSFNSPGREYLPPKCSIESKRKALMVILRVFLVWSQEASGKHAGDPKGDLQVPPCSPARRICADIL